jgi:two-component system NtrC family sensor kinase
VTSVLEETLKFTKHQVEKNKVRLVEELAESLPQINGHSGQLQQVFTNLILNAAQAMPDGGSLTVASRIGEDAKTAHISFTDTGVGISEKNIDKIFEPFFTSKNVGEGTGLGLSVSYGLIKNHGGEIKVSSRMGQGTTFTVILPVAGGEVAKGIKDEKELAIGG